MGMAHALGLEGAAQELVDFTPHAPLLRSSDLVYLGAELTQATAWEQSQAVELGLTVIGQSELCRDPRGAAEAARGHLAPGPFLVHVDVDVLDFLDAPIAENVNGRNTGPSIADLGRTLSILLADLDCRGVSLGQLDPAHASADPTALPRLVGALSSALSGHR
jgi:arginase